jgi:Spy/CpxP family protein refolding chaperone
MTKIVVIVGFVVAFAAGLMVGMDSHRPGAASPTTKPSYPSWLVAELNLTTKQQEEMHKIWSETAKKGRHEQDEARRQLRRERDEAIAALVRPEDYGRYDQILKAYNDQMDALDREARKSFEQSVERTKPLLTPEQQTKYAELLARHQWDRPQRPRERENPRENIRRPGDASGATSRPMSQP